MAISYPHIYHHKKIIELDDFLQDPVICIGLQDCNYNAKTSFRRFKDNLCSYIRILASDIENNELKGRIVLRLKSLFDKKIQSRLKFYKNSIPDKFNEKTYNEILKNYGAEKVETLDFFDERADYQHDMNEPIDNKLVNKYNTVIDIGSIEHVFDTRQHLINLANLLKVEGNLFIHTPCSGYYKHGLYAINPESILGFLKNNGFDIKLVKFTTMNGALIRETFNCNNIIFWIVAKKVKNIDNYEVPQQGLWDDFYNLDNKSHK